MSRNALRMILVSNFGANPITIFDASFIARHLPGGRRQRYSGSITGDIVNRDNDHPAGAVGRARHHRGDPGAAHPWP